jgi:hypothetical protein
MNLGWMFFIIVALLIGWFVFDRPAQQGETLAATVVGVQALVTHRARQARM